jgi:ubiquitin carboxyl-terminal hydrolase 8
MAMAKPKGINNMGSTCYINSVLQCLGACPTFLNYVFQNKEHPPEAIIFNQLRGVYKTIFVDQETSSPRNFLRAVHNKIHSMMYVFEQNDINEFLAIIIDKLNGEICRPFDVQMGPYQNTLYDKQRKKMDDSWALSHKKEYSDLTDMFYGQTITQIICGGCGKIHHNHEVVMNIMLSIGDSKSIYECLDAHFADEVVNGTSEDPWKCDGCNQCVKSQKTTKLWRTPQILIISLKRFNSNLKKINTHIEAPFTIDISDHIIGPSKQTKYNLKSVAYHYGSFHGGHYFATCKHTHTQGDEWNIYDDEDVKKIDEIEDAVKAGYVYFYDLEKA